MEKIRYSEMFYSVQGEGRFVGVPSVFFRTFGCNFECRGFGQPRDNFIPIDQMPHTTTIQEQIQIIQMHIRVLKNYQLVTLVVIQAPAGVQNTNI